MKMLCGLFLSFFMESSLCFTRCFWRCDSLCYGLIPLTLNDKMYSTLNRVLRWFQNYKKPEKIIRPQNVILPTLADEFLTSLHQWNLYVFWLHLKILCKIHPALEEFQSPGYLESASVLWWQQLVCGPVCPPDRTYQTLCQKQWSLSLFPFHCPSLLLPSTCYHQYQFGSLARGFSLWLWLRICIHI